MPIITRQHKFKYQIVRFVYIASTVILCYINEHII